MLAPLVNALSAVSHYPGGPMTFLLVARGLCHTHPILPGIVA